MNRPIRILGAVLLTLAATASAAEEQITADAFVASLQFRSGTIRLPGGTATLSLPADYRYLSPEDAERVLVTAWGNPPGDETLGMIIGGPDHVLAEESWAAVITYEEDGHISDADADAIDYDELLATMQETSRASNAARMQAGYEEVELVGWATTPRYDRVNKKLLWAKELRFGDIPVNTLNYNLRILGREGVLVFNIVATMPQLEEIEAVIPTVMAMTNFNPGYRYADFDPGIDQVAAFGIGALIAGNTASNAGLPAKLGAVLVALKKFWTVMVIALGAALARVLRRGRDKAVALTS